MIYAVIITYNPEIQLLDLEFTSISTQVDHIIYVDNGSKNSQEVEVWASDKENASFVWLNDNKGLGAAQNVGIRHALEDGASHIILFDQDTVVDNDFVTSLLEAEKSAIKDGLNVALTGPVYRSYDDFAYPVCSVEEGKLVRISQNSIDGYRLVTHIIASGSLIRREVFLQVGMMREDLFLGYIDFEYCFRAARYGFHCIVTNKACMRHQMGNNQIVIHGRKIGVYSPFRRYFDCRNTLLIQKDKTFPKVIRNYYLKLVFGKFIISLLYGPQRWKQLRYCLMGFYDGLLGRVGKCSIG